jgi:RNA polymerase sigma factor (sigma-70 family)
MVEMQTKSDAQLLREYSAQKSEAAFGDVVRRYADLVYSAALRQLGSPDLAGEIAQRVFIDLALKARSLASSLREDASLAGWLYRATRFAALNLLREERRRHAREREVMQELYSTPEAPPDWNNLAPLLDEAISALGEQERDALLLRFFQNQDFRTVGAALGVSDNAAQKRVAHSLEKLRAILQRRGVTTTTAALSIALASQAVQAAPAGLAAAWITASLASAATKGGATLAFLKLMSMTKLQLGLGAIIVGGLAATVAIQLQAESKVREENQALRLQLAGLAAENESLSNRVAQATLARPLADDQFRELLRLRGEVGMLRQQTNLLGSLREKIRTPQASTETPPLQFDEQAKFLATKAITVNAAKQIGLAFYNYAEKNNNQFPTNLAQLTNELGNAPNFGNGMTLDNFEMVNAGKASDASAWSILLRERNPRQSPQGLWQRVYLMSDGSAQVAIAPDGNFDTWEQNWQQNQTGPTADINQ